jgi:hypothetical protein
VTRTGLQPRPAPDLLAWRRGQLVLSGFPPELAERVAGHGSFDLHALIELAERGCPPELATRILSPLDGGFEGAE